MQFSSTNTLGYLFRDYKKYWIRLFISVSLLLIFPWLDVNPFSLSINNPIIITIAGYTLLTTTLTLLNSGGVLTDYQHKYATIFTDICGITLLLILGGNSTSPICAAYYLLVIHNSIDTNRRELLVSTFLATLGFTSTLYLNSYWNSQITLGIGLIFGLLFISLILYREITNDPANKVINTEGPAGHLSRYDHSDLKLLLITNDSKDRHMLLSHIGSWGINVDTYNSSLRAFAELVNHAESDNRYTTVIVDSLNLDMNPIQLAKYIRLDSALSNIHLIHLSPEHSDEHKEQLLAAGYSTLLNTPIDKTILFDVLHSYNTQTTTGKNITRLIHHYSSKTSIKQPLDILLGVCNQVEQEFFRTTLERNGQRVYTVNSGSQTLDALHTHQFDLVILDFKMPDLEGKEIIRLYYYTYLNEDWVPFIALVDEATPEILSQCREADVNAILVRPVGQEELLITVADIASSKTKQDESIDEQMQPPHIHETLIKDDDNQILNTQTLMQLEELSSSNNFLSQLTTRFNQDMEILMEGLEQSINNNCFTDFKDLIYALKDSSCNLGANSLHKLSLLALQINQREFQGQAKLIVDELYETMTKTKYALQHYVTDRDNSASKNE